MLRDLVETEIDGRWNACRRWLSLWMIRWFATTTRSQNSLVATGGAKEVCGWLVLQCVIRVLRRDFPTYGELLANQSALEEIAVLEVDSIGYLSLEGLLKSASLPADHYCTACWSGQYRIPVSTVVSKFAMERHQMQLFDDVEL